MTAFEQRRAEFARKLGQNGVAVIPGATTLLRNRDTEHEFRQSSDFFYLTGFSEPDAVLVIAPHHEDGGVLFTQPKDRSQEAWTGKRAGIEGARTQLGINRAHEISALDAELPGLLAGAQTLHYEMGNDEPFDRRILEALKTARRKTRRKGTAPIAIASPAEPLHEMRLIKSPEEIATMRRAGEITRLGHIAGMSATRPQIYEYEVEAVIEYTYHKHGAQSVAYPSIVASGDNATILHYNTNRDILQDGTLVLVDSGCEYNMYASDVTRTWPVNGKFTPEQKAIYEIVLSAQKAGIDAVHSGARYNVVHEAAVAVIIKGLINLGLLKGSVDENLASERYLDYYYHSTGHLIGLDVHDVGRYREAGSDLYRMLEPGMTLTVEPGIYVPRDLECDERFKGIGIRIEDDILCTATGPEILSAAIPREIAEIEALVGSAAAAGVR
ncbi:MAG: Xaa-Pro aminopeptidase [Vulcanimicrobiaceae bacterium]